MSNTFKGIIKKLPYVQKIYKEFISKKEKIKYFPRKIYDGKEGNKLIYEIIRSKSPAAIGRLGSNEVAGLLFYLNDKNLDDKAKLEYIIKNLHRGAGVFPPTINNFKNFCEKYLQDLQDISLFAVWFNKGEAYIVNNFSPQAKLTTLFALEPYFYNEAWSRVLKNKRVLVIHPFAKTIESQYKKREVIWLTNSDILPEFHLETLKVPLSDFLIKSPFTDWIEALDYLKKEMSRRNFDVAIIGAGAWGLPLTVYAKRLGKIGINIAGGTQILFGIKGRRWDYNKDFNRFYNVAWCRPSTEETPPKCDEIEGGCYW